MVIVVRIIAGAPPGDIYRHVTRDIHRSCGQLLSLMAPTRHSWGDLCGSQLESGHHRRLTRMAAFCRGSGGDRTSGGCLGTGLVGFWTWDLGGLVDTELWWIGGHRLLRLLD